MTAVILIITIMANIGIALADFASAKFALNNSAQVGVSTRWLPMLGALKAAGAAGLLLGLLECSADWHCRGARSRRLLHRRRGHARAGPSVLQHRLPNGVSGPGGRIADGVVVRRMS
jgi:DoxX-like family